MPYCIECGGKLNWDRKLRQYSCQSCGLTFTDAELSAALDRLYTPQEDEESRKNRRNRDYLEWWFQRKEKR